MKAYQHLYITPAGMSNLLLSGDEGTVTGLAFTREERLCREDRPEGFGEVIRWLDTFFQGKDPGAVPPVRILSGSPFQREIWSLLQKIPYGQTVSYGWLAVCVAHRRGIPKMSAQAVGGAVHRNPIGILIPCHRVVGKNGELTGFGGGLETKMALLSLEGHSFEQKEKLNHVRIVNFTENRGIESENA